MLGGAVLLQHQMERGHAAIVDRVHVRTALGEPPPGREVARLDRAEERRLTFRDGFEVGTVVEQHVDPREVVVEGRRPQRVVRIGASLEEKPREVEVPTPRHAEPHRSRAPRALGERRVVHVQATLRAAPPRGERSPQIAPGPLTDIDAAAQVQPRTPVFVAHIDELGCGIQRRRDRRHVERAHLLRERGLRGHGPPAPPPGIGVRGAP